MRADVADTLVALAAELQRAGEAFALATVVRCEAPTSAKPGAKVLVRGDGSVQGWVGGACAEPVVVREALEALRDGRPRLIGLYGEGGRIPGRTEGVLEYEMTCHSGGTLEIAVSILAEIIQHRRSDKVRDAEAEPAAATVRIGSKDPICGMIVDGATVKFRSEFSGRTVYFCCRHCKEMFDQDPERYRLAL